MKLRSYKYRIYPTVEQAKKLAKAFGCARWTWNYSLNLREEHYKKEKSGISDFDLMKAVAALKDVEETKWLSDAPAQALQQVIKNQGVALTNFFKKRAAFPNFKSKHDKQSIQLPQGVEVDFSKGKIFLPKLKEVSAVFHRRFDGKVKTTTVSKTKTNKYFVSIIVEESGEEMPLSYPVEETCLGIDMGIKQFAILSSREKIDNPKHFKKALKCLKKAQRQLARAKKGSKRRDKKRAKVAKIHEYVSNVRADFHHKLTRRLVDNQAYGSFAMEDLGIKDVMEKENRHMAREVADAGWFQFKTFLTYKANRAGKQVLSCGRYEATSKTCSCGHKNDSLKLSDREWNCPVCGAHHDRDYLAADNIKAFVFIKRATADFIPLEQRELTHGENNYSLNREKPLFTPGETPVA